MNLGTQYYRPPFPESRYWEDDLRRMRDSGLNTVQLWVLWAWVEAEPGTFRFDDYDLLIELAGKHGLGFVLSTIAEIQPAWIHRLIPDSRMVNHLGHTVMSTNRNECHFGLTPGGCTDNPEVWKRMSAFLATVGERYSTVEHLRGWDAWNELRWNVNADGLVCYCPHTLRAWHEWLDGEFGGLDGLNAAWKRRYASWEDVVPPKPPHEPYTTPMAFAHFLTWRADRHAAARYAILKKLNPDKPVTVHGGQPTALYAGSPSNTPLDRGNDWAFADHLDGVGCSSFPKWFTIDDADFGMRIEFVKSAARDRHVWLSELQGGRAAHNYQVHDSVDACSQQRWIWNGIACGADTVLFWCWRDEVFTSESAGFGIIGQDGLAEERLAAMKITGHVLEAHGGLLDAYTPATPEMGVFFSPQSYYIDWASERDARRAQNALLGYARALVRTSVPYAVVEEEHLHALDGLKLLFLPRTVVTSRVVEERLAAFVRGGGTLVCESECGAFSPAGLYRYPIDRFTSRLAGICEVGRRRLESPTVACELGETVVELEASQWLTPWQTGRGTVLASSDDGALVTEVRVGEGRMVLCGAYFGEAYTARRSGPLERFVEHFARTSGWTPDVEVLAPRPTADSFLYVKHGTSGGRRLVFVFFQEGQEQARLRFRPGFLAHPELTDLITGRRHAVATTQSGQQELELPVPDWRFAVLAENPGA